MDTNSGTPPADQPSSQDQIPYAETVEPVRHGPPPQVVVARRGGGCLRLLAVLGWAGFLFCVLMLLGQFVALGDYFDTSAGLNEKFHSGAKFASNKVAIIDISGLIVGGDGYVKRQIDRVRQDQSVKAIVLRIDSPGGTITGSDFIYHHLNKLRDERKLPIVVSMGSLAASGGYYVAMAVGDQEDSIYAEPTTTTGSIGVIIPHYDFSGLLTRFDIKDDSIMSHPRKEILSMTRPISEDHREILERYVGEAFDRFKEIVKSGRPRFRDDEAALDELATGEMFTANQALDNGLIDQIGFVEKAIERALDLAGLSLENARVVQFQRPTSLLSLAGMARAPSDGPDLAALLDLTVPRAYYLFTTLPPLMTSY